VRHGHGSNPGGIRGAGGQHPQAMRAHQRNTTDVLLGSIGQWEAGRGLASPAQRPASTHDTMGHQPDVSVNTTDVHMGSVSALPEYDTVSHTPRPMGGVRIASETPPPKPHAHQSSARSSADHTTSKACAQQPQPQAAATANQHASASHVTPAPSRQQPPQYDTAPCTDGDAAHHTRTPIPSHRVATDTRRAPLVHAGRDGSAPSPSRGEENTPANHRVDAGVVEPATPIRCAQELAYVPLGQWPCTRPTSTPCVRACAMVMACEYVSPNLCWCWETRPWRNGCCAATLRRGRRRPIL
jgi:hypothetical protein